MTSEKDYNKHKTEKQLSQLKDRLDKARYICPPPSCTAPLGRAHSTSVIAAGFGHLPLQLDLHQVMLNAPWATVHVWNKWEAQISTLPLGQVLFKISGRNSSPNCSRHRLNSAFEDWCVSTSEGVALP